MSSETVALDAAKRDKKTIESENLIVQPRRNSNLKMMKIKSKLVRRPTTSIAHYGGYSINQQRTKRR